MLAIFVDRPWRSNEEDLERHRQGRKHAGNANSPTSTQTSSEIPSTEKQPNCCLDRPRLSMARSNGSPISPAGPQTRSGRIAVSFSNESPKVLASASRISWVASASPNLATRLRNASEALQSLSVRDMVRSARSRSKPTMHSLEDIIEKAFLLAQRMLSSARDAPWVRPAQVPIVMV